MKHEKVTPKDSYNCKSIGNLKVIKSDKEFEEFNGKEIKVFHGILFQWFDYLAVLELRKELGESTLEGLDGFNYIWLIGCSSEESKQEDSSNKNHLKLVLWKLDKIEGMCPKNKL